MFTGLIQGLGTVRSLSVDDGGGRLRVAVPDGWALEPGESVAVEGVCLTAVPDGLPDLVADLARETLARTCLGDRRAGDVVNLERSLSAGERLGGHVVQGHVDAVVELLEARAEGAGARHRYSLAVEDRLFLVPKGSVAVDGVSLTVADLGPDWFEVALIPHTLAETSLSRRRAGDRANVEHDVLGRYVLRALADSGRLELSPEVRRRLGL
jgi:riboflavin synthase